MSSLSATQADGYYLPPEYFDSGKYKTQSKNQFAGSKGHNQYLQKGIVRFELPYKGICEKCHVSIGRGTRYNAQKVRTDESYFSTPIVEFQMTCRNCQHPWKIRTNPQQRGFDYVEGITLQAGQEEVVDMTAAEQTVTTSLDRLDSMALGERKGKTDIEKLHALQKLQSQTTLEDASLNASIRANFRVDRKLKRLKGQQTSKVGWREGMEWLNSTVDDQLAAKSTVYGQALATEQQRFQKVRKSSIFDTSSVKKRRQLCHRTLLSTSAVVPPETVSSQTLVGDFVANTTSDQIRKQHVSTPSPMAVRVKQKIQLSVITSPKLNTSTAVSTIAQNVTKSQSNTDMADILAAYGSSSSEDEGC